MQNANEFRSPLTSPLELTAAANRGGWVVFDCRHALTEREYGRRSYDEGHIPGARFADLDSDLCGPISPAAGRHPLPDWGIFCEWLGGMGVSNSSRVAAYDDGSGAFAARLWWMLRVLGHRQVAVLDGGLARWVREGHPTDREPPPISAARFEGRPDPGMTIDLEELETVYTGGSLLLVDARGGERFRGENEPIDPIAGHIPGAINLPFPENLAPEGVFLPPDRLRERLTVAYGGHPAQATVHYCGSGVSACHNLLAQEVAGLPAGRLYPGSWSQWCADPSRPVKTGAHPSADR